MTGVTLHGVVSPEGQRGTREGLGGHAEGGSVGDGASAPYAVSISPLSTKFGTCKTVTARFWPWLSGKSPQNRLSCSFFARGTREGLGSHAEGGSVGDGAALREPRQHDPVPRNPVGYLSPRVGRSQNLRRRGFS